MKRLSLAVLAIVVCYAITSMICCSIARAEVKPRPPVAELDAPTTPERAIYNVCVNPQRDYNGDGLVNANDAHMDVYYDGAYGNAVWLGIYRDMRCDDDTSMAMQRVYMLAHTTRRVYNVKLYMWTFSLSIGVLQDDKTSCEHFDAWQAAQWQDCADVFEMWCNPVWGDIPAYHYIASDPRTPITAYCVSPHRDYNSDGRIDYDDCWVQIEMPYRDTPPEIDVWMIAYDVNNFDPELWNYQTYFVRHGILRLFVNVASGIHNVYTEVRIVIPDGYPCAGDVLEYVTWSEDGALADYDPSYPPVEYN